mmetsp:Transcript_15621/g.28413  ORF Transcript_15621/g.28413 Transcript_15621/m.28413 type:complete len:295 (-) Transcript_15621:37-921(-)
MTKDGNLVRDDSTDFERQYLFLPFACLYGVLYLYTVYKLIRNWARMKPLIRFVFLNVSAFFFLRTFYWLDFAFNYPKVLYFYLELLPYYWLISICSVLAFSWLKVSLIFLNDIPLKWIHVIGLVLIGLNALMYSMFTLLYFMNWYYHRSILMLTARIQNNIWLFFCICFLITSGRKLALIVETYLTLNYARRIRVMMWTAVFCLALRIIINTALLIMATQLEEWKESDGGRGHAIFGIFDYLVTEVAFLFFLSYAIQVPVKKTYSSNTDLSYVSQETERDASHGLSIRLMSISP